MDHVELPGQCLSINIRENIQAQPRLKKQQWSGASETFIYIYIGPAAKHSTPLVMLDHFNDVKCPHEVLNVTPEKNSPENADAG